MDENISFEKIEITPDLVKELKAELRRTGLGPQAILRGTRNSRPKGLNTYQVKKWLNGSECSANKVHVSFIRQRWASFPDKKEVWLGLDTGKRALLKQKLHETGLSVNSLFAERSDLPEGMNWKILHSYFASSRPKIKKEYYYYILKVCEENKDKGYTTITTEFLEKLSAEITRTDVKPHTLIKNFKKKNETIQVKAFTITAWLSGRTDVADQSEMNWVLDLYTALPDKQVFQHVAVPIRKNEGLFPISDKDLELLRQYKKVAGILPGFIFIDAKNIPDGLASNIVGSWLNGVTKNANPKFVQWVLKRCREVVQAATEIE